MKIQIRSTRYWFLGKVFGKCTEPLALPRARVEFLRPSPNAKAKENVRLTHSAPRIVGTRATRASRARTSRESKRARSDAKDDARAVRRNRDRAVREAQDVLTMFSIARVVPLDV
ncbi:hypothetical protein BE221DRAFT_63775 [Ostreococcus tauri]|uniref:Uncharacterized protein n=1 Tax=Ostreococcus tauri TaxID=70448 RepID=A0A1Y5I4J7_OSTTA|nr:hypothetical protein BE221DRAFT_63775 [Ostreococcus tauri]